MSHVCLWKDLRLTLFLVRFTVWHQYTNRRYENEGSRIDYTLIDRSLEKYVNQEEISKLRCGGVHSKHTEANTEESALCAATANNQFLPASFRGGGIVSATQAALDTQFGDPHSG